MVAFGRFLPFVTGSNRPILLQKSVLPDCPESERCRSLFFARLREIFVRILVRPFKISISRAYFSALEVCNQLIHYYWMQTITEGTSFASMLVFSDYQRHKWAYEIRIDALLSFFGVFCEESSAITSASFKWCEKKQPEFIE